MTVCLIIHVFCNSCEPEIVFVLICPLAEQFQVHRSYKTHESTMSSIGNFEENIDLSHIHLAITHSSKLPNLSLIHWVKRSSSLGSTNVFAKEK